MYPVPGATTCRYHGGKSRRGIASGTFKDGRYSKYLPGRLLARYAESASDPALLSLREEILVIDARLADVLGRVDTGESGALWSKARQTWRDLRKAMAAGDANETRQLMADVDDILGRGAADWSAWAEVGKLLNARKTLVESERKAMIDAHQMMSTDQVLVLIQHLTSAVKAHVSDPQQLSAISDELSRVLAAPSRGESETT